MYTYRGAEPPAKVSRGPGDEPSFVDGSLLCQGSIVSGAHVERSIISTGCYVSHDAHVTDSILFPGVRVGPGARLHRCIIDKNVIVPDWYRVGLDETDDRDRFTVSESGITVIAKEQQLGCSTPGRGRDFHKQNRARALDFAPQNSCKHCARDSWSRNRASTHEMLVEIFGPRAGQVPASAATTGANGSMSSGPTIT